MLFEAVEILFITVIRAHGCLSAWDKKEQGLCKKGVELMGCV